MFLVSNSFNFASLLCIIVCLFVRFQSNLPTAVQTLLGGSPHRGHIAAPTVPYDLPLVRPGVRGTTDVRILVVPIRKLFAICNAL